jgi:hypothetical protein
VREHTVAIPEPVRLQTVKVDDLRAHGPGWIVLEQIILIERTS